MFNIYRIDNEFNYIFQRDQFFNSFDYIRSKINCQVKQIFMSPDFLIADLWNELNGLF